MRFHLCVFASILLRAQGDLGGVPCSQESSLHSITGDQPTNITFVNATAQPIRIYWLDYTGHRVLYTSLPAGASYVQATFVTHPWVVASAGGTCIAIFFPPGTARVGSLGATEQLQVSSPSLQFSGIAGGDSPPQQTFLVSTVSGSQAVVSAQADGGVTGTPAPFLSFTPMSGATPASFRVSASTGNLSPGTYTGRIHISNVALPAQNPVDVSVGFTVKAAPPRLQVSPAISRAEVSSAAAGSQTFQLVLHNQGGGGVLNFSAVSDSPWISALPASGIINPNAPGTIRVVVNPQGLRPGPYRGSVQISASAGSSSAGTVSVPVLEFVDTPGPSLDLGVTGVRFVGRQGQGAPDVDPVLVLNRGDATSQVHWNAEVLTGADWLVLGSSSGISTPGSPGTLILRASPAVASLPAGTRYGLVKVSDPQAAGSPRFLTAVLDLAGAGSPVAPDLTPAGLFFTVATGAASSAVHRVSVRASSVAPVAFQPVVYTAEPIPWLTVNAGSQVTSLSSPATLSISADPTLLPAGVHTGEVRIAIGSVLRAVNVTLLVLANASIVAPQGREATGCNPTKVVATETGLVNMFSAPATFPASLIVQLHDDCGSSIPNGSAVASFSNGDPPLRLESDSTGTYSATWQPGVAFGQTTITVDAFATGLASSEIQLVGSVTEPLQRAPVLVKGGTLNNLNQVVGAAVAPGTVVQVYGSGLAPATQTAQVIPLPTVMESTQILVGGINAPFYYVSDSLAVLQIPSELPINRQSVMVVQAKDAFSLPEPISLSEATPGVAVLPGGIAIAQRSDYSLVDAAHPAHPGEVLVLYLVGMGGTDVNVPSGTQSPLANTSVPPVVTVGGLTADILYAGLTPGGIGLYQINFRVPAAPNAGILDLVIKQDGTAANAVQLPVAPPL